MRCSKCGMEGIVGADKWPCPRCGVNSWENTGHDFIAGLALVIFILSGCLVVFLVFMGN